MTEDQVACPIHNIGGLLRGERAMVVFAGTSEDGENWFLHWYRNGQMATAPKGPFSTPDEALAHFISIR